MYVLAVCYACVLSFFPDWWMTQLRAWVSHFDLGGWKTSGGDIWGTQSWALSPAEREIQFSQQDTSDAGAALPQVAQARGDHVERDGVKGSVVEKCSPPAILYRHDDANTPTQLR